MAKTSAKSPRASAVLRHPHCEAVAATEQRFDSAKIAVRAGSRVCLEFTPSMVVVHDPSNPTPTNPLGSILYSHVFCGVKTKAYSPEIARKTGQVADDMFYLLLEMEEDSEGAICKFCGKRWAWSDTSQHCYEVFDKHLEAHSAGR